MADFLGGGLFRAHSSGAGRDGWAGTQRSLLLLRYPGGTTGQLEEARSYASGGVIIEDMGCYPMGSGLITNMMHCVRPGDFVRSLLGQARSRTEYAFALGALAH